jgi:hypothetical protein
MSVHPERKALPGQAFVISRTAHSPPEHARRCDLSVTFGSQDAARWRVALTLIANGLE